MRTIMSENIYNNQYYNEALSMQGVADTAVLSDPNKFFTYAQFITNLNNNVISGPKTFPGITSFMNARSASLSNSVYFQQMPPSITNVQPSGTSPSVNSSVYITAQIAGASDVYLGYRKSVMDVFTKVTMYDDGLHGDGAAGDGLYGASMTVASSQMQYYIYAENSGAGKFSPERAEYEYHILNASFIPVQSGELVINELMAINNSTVQNANGVYADWIEFYNNTSGDLLLDNIYLSDDISTPFKWQFPVGTMITAGGF